MCDECGESKIEERGKFRIAFRARAKLERLILLTKWIAVEEESLKHHEPSGANHGMERNELSRPTATFWRKPTLENRNISSLGLRKESERFVEVL